MYMIRLVMIRKFLVPLFAAGLLSACTPTVDIRGNLPAPEDVAQLKIGQTTDEQVLSLLGTPSSAQHYGDETWYYIYQKIETVSFFAPKIVDYQALTVSFDGSGKVKQVRHNTQKDMKDVEVVTRETPTAGREYSFIEQLIGNVGKFTKDKKPGS